MMFKKQITKYFNGLYFIFIALLILNIYIELPTSKEKILQERNRGIAIAETYRIAEAINGNLIRFKYRASNQNHIYYSVSYQINQCITHHQWRMALESIGYSNPKIVLNSPNFNKAGVIGEVANGSKENYCDKLDVNLEVYFYK